MAVASAERSGGGDQAWERVTPSLTEARALAANFNLIPVWQTFIDDTETPVSAFLKLRGEEPAFLLESPAQRPALVAERRRRPVCNRSRRTEALQASAQP